MLVAVCASIAKQTRARKVKRRAIVSAAQCSFRRTMFFPPSRVPEAAEGAANLRRVFAAYPVLRFMLVGKIQREYRDILLFDVSCTSAEAVC